MTKFTDEEISLCKQVAEKHRKEIEYGDWILNEDGFVKVWPYKPNCKRIDFIPLWIISDCLEFLRKRDWLLELENSATPKYGKYYCACFMPRKHPGRKHGIYKYGNTTLETLLKVVLAVLEEGK